MITVLEYLVIAAVIGLVVFLIAVVVFGRGEQMAALSPRTSPSELPDGPIGGDDVRRVRFGLALRGYRMSDVDWTLDRLAGELDRLHRRVTELGGGPLPPGVGSADRESDLFAGRHRGGGPQPDDSGAGPSDPGARGAAPGRISAGSAGPEPGDDPDPAWAPPAAASSRLPGGAEGNGPRP